MVDHSRTTSRLGPIYMTWKKAGRYRVKFNNKPAGVGESLPAAFESADAATDPVSDVIQGAKSAHQFMVVRVRKDRRLLAFSVEKLVVQIDQGTYRVEPAR